MRPWQLWARADVWNGWRRTADYVTRFAKDAGGADEEEDSDDSDEDEDDDTHDYSAGEDEAGDMDL